MSGPSSRECPAPLCAKWKRHVCALATSEVHTRATLMATRRPSSVGETGIEPATNGV